MTGQRVDRVPFIKVFGGTNRIVPVWEQQCPGISRNIDSVLKFEGGYRGWQIAPVNMTFTRIGEPVTISEDHEKTILEYKDGTVKVVQKGGDFATHTIEWPVKTRQDWDRVKQLYLQADDPSRFPQDWPDYIRRFKTRDFPLQLTHGGVYGFARTMMGDENLFLASYDDPGLVHDIMDSYTDMAIAVWEKMVINVDFDLIECWEDIASKNGLLVSPKFINEFMKPNYIKISHFAQKHGIKIILVDSDGFIEDLVGILVDCGVNAFYPFEVQAGNNVARVLARYPHIGVIGGLDKNTMATTVKEIDAEMEKAASLIRLGRFIPGPDHFVLSDVPWNNYKYFMERLRDIVLTTES